MPDYFSKAGFTSPKSIKQKVRIINVGKLDEMAELLSEDTENKKPLVDLENLGYTKLLGTGKVVKPLTVKVSSCSKSAFQKIKDAGGEVLTKAERKGE
jgi:large subunit ribosomal protein L15